MKKSIIVLLVAVLVAGFAFAGTLKGSAGLEFNVDLQPDASTGVWGFKNASEWKYSFNFEYDTTAVEVKGEGKLWAELAISGSAIGKITGNKAATDVVVGTDAVKITNGTLTNVVSVTLSKANIHIGEDITIGLLNEGEGVDFAFSYRDVDGNGAPDEDYVYDDHESENIGGFTVTYKEWYGGFAARGRWDTDPAQFTFYGHGATPEFKFAEDQIIVQAGGYAAYANNTNVFERATFVGAGAKAEYVSDSLNAYLGADLMYDNGALAFEALAKASYAIGEDGSVGVDAYVGPGAFRGYDGDDEKKPFVDARVWGEYTLGLSDDIDLYLYAEADARNLLVDYREVIIDAVQETTIQNFGISLEEYYMVFTKILNVSAKVDYTAEKFNAWVETGIGLNLDGDAAIMSLPFECGISSEAIIDKAEIGLKYTEANFAKNPLTEKIISAGLVTAYVTIGFDSSK